MAPDFPLRSIAWPLILAAAAIGGSLVTACMMPFVAIATLAAATMTRGSALITVLGVWAVDQLLGFGLLGYPMTAYAVAWGGALGIAALIAMLTARNVIGPSPVAPARLAAAFLVAFVGYEALLFGFALAAGGTETFAPAIVLRILANEATWFGGLGVLYIALTRAAPRLVRAAPAARPA